MRHAAQTIATQPPEPDQRGFMVGLDPEGHWIAKEIHGLGGGIFVSQAAALRYACVETGHRPGAVCAASAPITLDWAATLTSASRPIHTGF